MKYLNTWFLVSALGLTVGLGATAGCGSSSSGSGGSSGTGGSAGASTGGSAGASTGGSAGASTGGSAGASTGGSAGASTGGSAGSGSGGSAGAGGAGCVNLTVKNYDSWCSVSVAGGAAKTAATQTVCVPPGKVNLTATAANSTFKVGSAPWHDTDSSGTTSGSGQSATSSTTETVGTSPDCVWVCCPFQNGSGCPTTDQCP